MPRAKKHIADVWCPRCKDILGKIYERHLNDEVYDHVTTPKKLPTRCLKCEGVVERKPL